MNGSLPAHPYEQIMFNLNYENIKTDGETNKCPRLVYVHVSE